MRLGETLGQYRVVDVVGHGGMAAVYVGEHLVVQHRVAIKVVHPRHLDNPRMAQRFLNEARAVAAIRHPGIVEFYDLGRADDGRAYIVMELLAGETLAQRLQAGAIPAAQTIAFGRQMASALGAAHARSIVHRDLKPANVFLVPDPDVPFGERAKILDFGIAKHTTQARLEEITGTGMMIGTPAHMAPEQCRGDKEIDGRADVYAIGVLLYRMATGRLPFDGGETGEIISRQLYEQCPTASSIAPRVPSALSDVIGRCMLKERQRRYQSMEELGAALAEVAQRIEVDAPALLKAVARRPTDAPTPRRIPALTPVLPTTSSRVSAMTPTAPWTAVLAGSSSPTLTRTLVDAPSLFERARFRWRELALATAAAIAVFTTGMVAIVVLRAEAVPPSTWPVPPPPAQVDDLAIKPVTMTDEAACEPAAPVRARPTRAKDGNARRNDDRDEPRPRRGTRNAPKAKAPPAPPPAPRRAPEDPFASVATPAVY